MDKKTEWILQYIDQYLNVDVANGTFINRYIESFYSENPISNISIVRKEIGKILSTQFKQGILKRVRYGLKKQPGSPKWVYVYSKV